MERERCESCGSFKTANTGEIKLCDICGESFKGFSYHVIDENYNVQKGLIQCGKCLSGNLEDNLND